MIAKSKAPLMPQGFDPYYKWLAIPPHEQPPNHYRLLGIPPYTHDSEVIENAADQRMAHLRAASVGKRVNYAQQLLNELAGAKVCLLNADQKAAYDSILRQNGGDSLPKPPPLVASPFPISKKTPLPAQPQLLLNSDGTFDWQRFAKPALAAGFGVVVAVLISYLVIASWNWSRRESARIVPPREVATQISVDKSANMPEMSAKPAAVNKNSAAQQNLVVVPPTPAKSDVTSIEKVASEHPPSSASPTVPTNVQEKGELSKAARIAVLEEKLKNTDVSENLRVVLADIDEFAGSTGRDALQMKVEAILDRGGHVEQTAQYYEDHARALIALLKQAANGGRSDFAKKHMDQMLILARNSANQALEREATLLVLQLK